MDGESPSAAALREASEEAKIDAAEVELIDSVALVHPQWSYTTFIALLAQHSIYTDLDQGVQSADAESIELRWVALSELTADTPTLPLHPAFASSLPSLAAALRRHLN